MGDLNVGRGGVGSGGHQWGWQTKIANAFDGPVSHPLIL